MTPETETNINEAIDWLQQTGGSLQNFASEQAPLYCREVVAWEFWSGAIFGGIGVALSVIGFAAAMKVVRWMKEDYGEPSLRTMFAFVIAMLCLILGPVMAGLNISQAIKAAVSPRLVIVEHLTGLRK
jgi:H+/Cl- antiporter ClcA